MDQLENRYIARNMMTLHGLRAQAVVHERLAESRMQGNAEAMQLWQSVQAAIADLRRTGQHEVHRE